MANKKDLATGLIGTALTTSATTLVLQTGYGAAMPATPFFMTLTPAGQLSTLGNSEIVSVTARSTDTLTIVRAQKGTSAKAFAVGDIAGNGVYVGDENLIYSAAEIDTGKIWVDGRIIYRKVIRGNFNVVVGSFTVPHGISGLSSSLEVVSMSGGFKIGNGTVAGGQMQVFNQYRETSGNWMTMTALDATNLSFASSFGWGTSWITCVLEYVK